MHRSDQRTAGNTKSHLKNRIDLLLRWFLKEKLLFEFLVFIAVRIVKVDHVILNKT